MTRGASRSSIALVVMLGLSVIAPAAVRAGIPVSLVLEAAPTTAFTDELVTLTVTASPPTSGLQINFTDSESSLLKTSWTDDSGVAVATIRGTTDDLIWIPHFVQADFAGNSSYDPATSNVVEVDLSRHPSSVALTFGTPWADGEVNTVDPLVLHGRVVVTTCDGTIGIFELHDDIQTSVGAEYVHLINNGDGTTSCGIDSWQGQQPLGTHHYKAYFGNSWINDDSETGVIDVPITLITTNTSLAASVNPVEVGSNTRLTATLSSPRGSGSFSGMGAVTFFDGATELGTKALAGSLGGVTATLDVSFGSSGTHDLSATWGGSTNALPSTSATLALTVSPNVAHAADLGLGASTFYPVVDGYGDTVTIRGTLGETASVAITIMNPSTRTVVRRLSVARRDAGDYSLTWDGRTAAGALLPAGSYLVKQVVTDSLGASMSATSDVALSLKKLYWYSGSQTRYANQYSVKGSNGGTIAPTTTFYRGMRITLPLGTPGRWAALGYQFTLPSATTYSSISFWVLGKGTHTATIGLHDRRLGTWASGSAWIIDYFSPLATVPKAYGWTHVAGDSTYNRINRTVRGIVLADNWSSGRYDIAKVKLSYRYAILK